MNIYTFDSTIIKGNIAYFQAIDNLLDRFNLIGIQFSRMLTFNPSNRHHIQKFISSKQSIPFVI